MPDTVTMIGFGEAGETFARAIEPAVRAYDCKTDDETAVASKTDDYRAAGVEGCRTIAEALRDASVVMSLVTADQALFAARAAAPHLSDNALFLDLNSVAPETKCSAAARIDAAGGRYVDVAVMAPVQPLANHVPLLVSGRFATDGAAILRAIGFSNVTLVPGEVGRASSIKMIRSVMIKGLDALTAECVIAAHAAGVLDEVLTSLDASPAAGPWTARADYNLDRMMVHGLRRASEMEEVAKTLAGFDVARGMTGAAILGQRTIGRLGLSPPPDGLASKLEALSPGVTRP